MPSPDRGLPGTKVLVLLLLLGGESLLREGGRRRRSLGFLKGRNLYS
jgi:hypothetical protein